MNREKVFGRKMVAEIEAEGKAFLAKPCECPCCQGNGPGGTLEELRELRAELLERTEQTDELIWRLSEIFAAAVEVLKRDGLGIEFTRLRGPVIEFVKWIQRTTDGG